ncbi:MAG: hypothetical protein SGJ03_09985 [Alphaproteobacteria bacterium]|nr:hypothetical protein [Alphaproteobacteria bacterium]
MGTTLQSHQGFRSEVENQHLEGFPNRVRIHIIQHEIETSPMTEKLDALLTDLREHPLDRNIDALSVDVWRRIDGSLTRAGAGLWAWRAAAVSLVMVSGVVAGGAAAARPTESPFAINAALSPLTLLEGAR